MEYVLWALLSAQFYLACLKALRKPLFMIDATADDTSWKNHLNLALKKPSPPWVESQKRQSLILATCVIWGNLAELFRVSLSAIFI